MTILKKISIANISIITTVTIMLLSQAPQAYAVTTNCAGFLVAGTYDAVFVPDDSFCTILSGVTINGDITIGTGASLMGTEGNTVVEGKITTNFVDDCGTVILFDFEVKENIDLRGCDIVVIFNSVIGTKIDVEFTKEIAIIAGSNVGLLANNNGQNHIDLKFNVGSTYQVFNNVVVGKIQVADNVIDPSSPTPTFVGGNTAGKIECVRNIPPPVTSAALGDNIAPIKQGQCSGL